MGIRDGRIFRYRNLVGGAAFFENDGKNGAHIDHPASLCFSPICCTAVNSTTATKAETSPYRHRTSDTCQNI